MNESENAFIVDSIPVPICKIACEKSSKVCRIKQSLAVCSEWQLMVQKRMAKQ